MERHGVGDAAVCDQAYLALSGRRGAVDGDLDDCQIGYGSALRLLHVSAEQLFDSGGQV